MGGLTLVNSQYSAAEKQKLKEKKALFVAAGTMTCTSVSGMGSGFSVFKALFPNDLYQKDLGERLSQFHKKEANMSPFHYYGAPEEQTLQAGIATVPCKSSSEGLLVNNNTAKTLEEQYKDTLRQTFAKAAELNVPLILQPLGIGIYGWPPETAAQFYHQILNETVPDTASSYRDRLQLQIPLYDLSSEQTADCRFASALLQLEQKNSHPVYFQKSFAANEAEKLTSNEQLLPPKKEEKSLECNNRFKRTSHVEQRLNDLFKEIQKKVEKLENEQLKTALLEYLGNKTTRVNNNTEYAPRFGCLAFFKGYSLTDKLQAINTAIKKIEKQSNTVTFASLIKNIPPATAACLKQGQLRQALQKGLAAESDKQASCFSFCRKKR